LACFFLQDFCFGSCGLKFSLPCGPCGFDIGKNVPDLLVIQLLAKTRHAAVKIDALACKRFFAAEFGIIEQQSFAVMPSVAGFIMGRGWQAAIFFGGSPIRFTFKVRAMTGSAVFLIQNLPSNSIVITVIFRRGFGPTALA